MRRILALLLISLTLSAQPIQIPKLGETIEVSIVNVDVVVTDRKGNRIHGLTREDFEIRENGKPQPITNFAEYAPDGSGGTFSVDVGEVDSDMAEQSEVHLTQAPARRTIVIFIEEMRIAESRPHETFESIREFVRNAVRPGDSATVVSWANRLIVRQEFTDDIDALEAAITKIEKESDSIRPDEGGAVRKARAFDAAFEASLAESDKSVLGDRRGGAEVAVNSLSHRELVLMRRKATVLTSLMESMSGVDGKKILLMAMHRFGIHPGLEYTAEVALPVFGGNIDTDPLRARLLKAANANGVTLYPIYPAGVGTASVGTGEEMRLNVSAVSGVADAARAAANNSILMNETASLVELAEQTGGLMAYGASGIADLLPQVVDDLDSYYSLAFRATPSGKDAARAITVTTKNRDYVVRTRQKIVEKSDMTQMNDRVTANLFQTLEHSVIPIHAELGEVTRVGKGRWSVPIFVRVPIASLMTAEGDGSATGAFSVYVVSGGAFGVISEVIHKTQPFTIQNDQLDRARVSHFTYELTTEVDALTDRISIGVRDEVSKETGMVRIMLPPQKEGRDEEGERAK